ncbi:hypothetical protein [Nocardia sp. NPDC050710]|uniref:hypothetical protein n=1 Tax=Nocardia sp. NPDC050710 TaxID=3157220 RepID=UPI0033EBB92B
MGTSGVDAIVGLIKSWQAGWTLAGELFAPKNYLAPSDVAVDRLGTLRALLGVGITALLLTRYAGPDWAEFFARDAALRIILSATVGFPVCLLAMAALLVCTKSGRRGDTARHLWQPLRTMGVGVLAIFALGTLLLIPCIGIFVVVAMAPFAVRAAFLITKHWFAAADGHLLLGPIVAVIVTWTVAVIDITDASPSALPYGFYLMLVLGGSVTITGLAVMEYRRAHRYYGVTFRGGSRPHLFR